MRSAGVSIAEYNVVQPLWHDALGIHELSDSLEDGFEVVLLWFTAHYDVEALVDVLASVTGIVHVDAILIGVEPDSVGPRVTGQHWTWLRAILDHTSVRVQHTLDLAAANRRQADLRHERQLVTVLCACNKKKKNYFLV